MNVDRRAAIGGLVCAAPFMATGAWAQAPDDSTPMVLDSWTDTYGRPTASVMLDGKGPFAFLVDTGSTSTVVSESIARSLGIEPLGKLTVIGGTGTSVSPYGVVERLETGAVARGKLRVAILPDRHLARGDGILGADVFAGRRLVFSIRDKVVRVEPSQRSGAGAGRSNMRLRQGMLAEIDGRVGRVATKLILDTGADFCLGNPALGRTLQAVYPRLDRIPRVRITGITGHKVVGELASLPRIDARAFTVEDSSAVIANAQIFKLWELEDEPAMIVGVDLLSRLESFSIDYGARLFDATLLSQLIARNPALLG
ncbi:MAG: hypothetical protein EON93_13105 [Burkholderiales bacterium]|nr:MAG: hypothetical protein EON93_13105 [Burkholderiales bacterium]